MSTLHEQIKERINGVVIAAPLACPSCKVAALRRQAGDALWRCGACRAEVEVEHPEDCECPKCEEITERKSA